MNPTAIVSRSLISRFLVLPVLLLPGCGLTALDSGANRPVTQACFTGDDTCTDLGVEACESAGGVPQGLNTYCYDIEPNDSFKEVKQVAFDDEKVAKWSGAVTFSHDVDIFSLGAFKAGDRMIVDANTEGSPLDITVALFDADQFLVHANDDRSGSSRTLDSYIEWIVRHDSDPYFIAVSSSAFARSNASAGPYSISISREPGAEVPKPKTQVLMLDFDGGQINSPTLGRTYIEPFNAGGIGRFYEGEDELLKELIRQTVADNFKRFDVIIITSDHQTTLDEDEYSTIYLGGLDESKYGLAEAVDNYNEDYCDDAIVYVETFSPNRFSHPPSVGGLATAIGNVAAHEAGHLLGLNHVDDDFALMDDTSPADAFLNDQEFTTAPMSKDIIPVGFQDAVMLLMETVGPNQLDEGL